MNVDQSTEELEKSLNIPSFEEELAASALPTRKSPVYNKSARIAVCPICGMSTVVGPEGEFRCPQSPHDKEDDNLSDIELQEYVESFVDVPNENLIFDENDESI